MIKYNRGVKIGAWHSRDNLDCIMTSKDISIPDAITEKVTVAGHDGDIDLSTVLTGGDIKFKNRKITINLVKIADDGQLMQPLSLLASSIHGKRLPIIFDEDPEFYYMGRVSIKTKINKTVAEITVTVDADPYKYRNDITTQITQVNGEAVVTYVNMRKRVTPTFIIEGGEIEVTYNTLKTSLSAGTHIIPALVFGEGDNIIKYKSTAPVIVKVIYQEARL